MLGLRPGGCREALERRNHLHGKTHIHMQEHVSTQSVPWTYGTSFRADRLPGSPAPAGTVVHGRQGLPRRPCFADLCHGEGGENMLPQGGGVRRGKGAGFLIASQNHPVILWPRVTVHEHTTSRVSTGWGAERGGGRRHEGI